MEQVQTRITNEAQIMKVMQQQILKDMVSKTYMVNKSQKFADDEEQCVRSANMQNSDHMKRIDRYMLHITEMVSDKSENKK